MKRILIVVVFAFCLGGLNAQTRSTTTKRTQSSTQKSRVTTNQRASNSTTNNSQPTNVRDRINQRLKDSAAAAAGKTNNSTTVINGITVPATGTTTNTATTTTNSSRTTNIAAAANTTAGTNTSTTTTGTNSVTNTGVQMNPGIPGTVPVTPTNPANIPGKPATREQERNNTTDMNRVQMNAINGNQVASQAQNPENNTKNFSGNMVGESQWGTNQIGENQWTPPNAIISGFTRDFPATRGATWTRDNAMNTFSARYRSGDLWTSSTYNASGTQLETRTELPLVGALPEPVSTFRTRQSAVVDFSRISRVDRPGRETLYEVRLSTGRVAYINNRGEEVPFQ
jgi:hypothetical protein